MADTLTGKGYAVTTSLAAALTAGAGETITIIGIHVTNIHATDACWVTVDVDRSAAAGVNSELCHQVSIPVNDSLQILNNGKVVMNATDVLKFQAEANSKLEVSISYLVQT